MNETDKTFVQPVNLPSFFFPPFFGMGLAFSKCFLQALSHVDAQNESDRLEEPFYLACQVSDDWWTWVMRLWQMEGRMMEGRGKVRLREERGVLLPLNQSVEHISIHQLQRWWQRQFDPPLCTNEIWVNETSDMHSPRMDGKGVIKELFNKQLNWCINQNVHYFSTTAAAETNTKRLDGRLPVRRHRFPPSPLSTRHGVTVTCFRAAQLVPDVVYRRAIATRGHLIATANVFQSAKSDVFVAKWNNS